MPTLIHHLTEEASEYYPHSIAIKYKNETMSYRDLNIQMTNTANGLIAHDLNHLDRVAIYTEKRIETIVSILAISKAGGVFVPINPLLKGEQITYILNHCDVKILITTKDRYQTIKLNLEKCNNLKTVVIIDELKTSEMVTTKKLLSWHQLQVIDVKNYHRTIDQDMAAILYTSGSTGKPKGVVLSHKNIIAGAISVAEYLELNANDKILSVLPLSFDYGLNQITTMLLKGGTIVLINHLFAKDIITIVEKEKITGLAAVPPLWIQLSQLKWPTSITSHLRYFTNSGGHMPFEILKALQNQLLQTKPYLMYGLTEAFRSTFLPPEKIETKPDSMGKAIPNAEILVVRPDGSLCDANEPGELVHRGVLVALGYWNDPEKTAERFKPLPNQNKNLPITETAVWSGDIVKRDKEGFLYFIGRIDETIKCSGYRISPTEIEEAIYATQLVDEAIAFGVPHPTLGQGIATLIKLRKDTNASESIIITELKKNLPAYMIPSHIEIVEESLPRNANGKIDRKSLSSERQTIFESLSVCSI